MSSAPGVRTGHAWGTPPLVIDDATTEHHQPPTQLSLTDLDAEPQRITDARVRFGAWLTHTPFDAARTYDIVLAVYEAMANVVEHAYAATTGRRVFDLQATYDSARLEVAVRDHGTWSDSSPGPLRGRGLPLIETLSDDVTLSSADSGTTVTMAWDVAPTSGIDTDDQVS
ncbi:ATP-binding protein [Rhodococcus sp. BP-349]|uniref:ATP-binding protein n=1 Tax=unclassified Rhodococcus (in: high G+C Gram-positive bacteria) TaxID=192944 RepID=UPI001C9BBC44|nr:MULTISPECIES: ATP-binding protein [unclassified Rhodococcus (in: high G+C Gram-positive bacteria)]MBY6538529.1 ATP-binding protein [Rhodococcus sp. BP-363]MBY6542866.1 ATP-binding protein [Rhodococcus sp. BP-369]MBY6562096.1 ATP-binding protein [Rhodococcus sp. BP-370]MBY6576388.1 ATP-binding protein [Rhodococcus sp. BP-364]MBY6585689.1 ATP-binding protein [Rhodococcus sp. BP-358]